jgi:hypothetical protein
MNWIQDIDSIHLEKLENKICIFNLMYIEIVVLDKSSMQLIKSLLMI